MAIATGKLGRGLSALISEKNQGEIARIPEVENAIRDSIPLDKIKPGRFQPRSYFGQEELAELSDSVKKNGVVQPILVRIGKEGSYEIIAGERRWRAAKMAGLKNIPSIIMDVDDKKALEIAIIENVQRQNLQLLEEAEGYQRLINEFGYTQDQLADVLGKSRSKVTNTLRLMNLPNEVKKMLNEERISAGHARALLGCNSSKDAVAIAELVAEKDLNVRQTEKLIKKVAKFPHAQRKESADKSKKARDQEIVKMELELSRKLGLSLKINDKEGRGEVIISYNSLSELDNILTRLEQPAQPKKKRA